MSVGLRTESEYSTNRLVESSAPIESRKRLKSSVDSEDDQEQLKTESLEHRAKKVMVAVSEEASATVSLNPLSDPVDHAALLALLRTDETLDEIEWDKPASAAPLSPDFKIEDAIKPAPISPEKAPLRLTTEKKPTNLRAAVLFRNFALQSMITYDTLSLRDQQKCDECRSDLTELGKAMSYDQRSRKYSLLHYKSKTMMLHAHATIGQELSLDGMNIKRIFQ